MEEVSVWLSLFMLVTGFFYGEEDVVMLPVDSSEYAEVIAVADGDTILVNLNGREEWVRYIGIDTPEEPRDGRVGECWHAEATFANEKWVQGESVRLVPDVEDRDQYGRLLRYVYVSDESGAEFFVNHELIRHGHADILEIYPNTSYAPMLEIGRDQAADEKRGMWAVCT